MKDAKYALEIMQEEIKNQYISPEIKYAFEASIDALKKQILTKPIIKNWSPAKCPSCGAELSESLGDGYYKHWESMKVCNCGQLLDWRIND